MATFTEQWDRAPRNFFLSVRQDLTLWPNGSASIGEPLSEAFLNAEELEALRQALNASLPCPNCEATPGDNEYCVYDGSPHAWIGRSADG